MSSQTPATTGSAKSHDSGAPGAINVLLVEDEENLLSLYNVALREVGTVRTASSVNDAMLVIDQTDWLPHIILLDLILPQDIGGELQFRDRSGFHILRHIKQQSHLASTPVIVMTNLDGTEDRALAIELGAVEYVVKSNILPKEVVQLIHRYTTLSSAL